MEDKIIHLIIKKLITKNVKIPIQEMNLLIMQKRKVLTPLKNQSKYTAIFILAIQIKFII